MEMNEGYADREDPGLTVLFPLVDRPGESLLVWTTTPWTLAANVAAAVGPELRYLRVRQGEREIWVGREAVRSALDPALGPFEVLEERPGSDLVGWRYAGPFDDLPRVAAAFRGAEGDADYEHRVVAWDEVGEEEGTGVVHIAPGCGAEDYALGKALGLPMIAPLDEFGVYVAGFGALSGRDVRDVTEQIVEHLRRENRFYRLEPYRHRYPHCWRCGTPLVFRLVDEWYISMGPVYDKRRSEVTPEEVDGSLRYQIMEVVDRIRWIPSFGYERELDWLLNMHDWMISKKRYWGLALPIYDCPKCGRFEVIGGREELRERAVEGWDAFEGHTPHRPWVDAVKIRCAGCGGPVARIPDVGNPWLDAGIVPFSTLHYREEPEYWRKWFPADFITESFPGQFRNWFYAMLAMSTVLRREPPFREIFGYATLFGEDGRPMHKSWGNAIDFDEAAERMGVDVMRWLFVTAKPEDNILFGWHAADAARRELLVLWNAYAFFVTYARLAGWTPSQGIGAAIAQAEDAGREWPALDRWILSRAAGLAARVEARLRDVDAARAAEAVSTFVDDLSTWYVRLARERMRRNDDVADRDAAFTTLHAALVVLARVLAPMLPFLTEAIYRNLMVAIGEGAESVHLTRFPTGETAALRDEPLEASMAIARRAVELARTLRSQAGIRTRQPLARMWLAVPGALVDEEALLALVRAEVNVKAVERIGDESELVERRVKPLLPRLGRRLGPKIPEVMAAAREGRFEIRPDGSVEIAGVTLARDEVEILASPRPGTAVAHDEGLVVVIDTELTPELLAEGDARELTRAIQDLRRTAGLELDDRIDLWLDGGDGSLVPHLDEIASDTLAASVERTAPPPDARSGSVEIRGRPVRIALRRVGGRA
jgi:isoleucyl-tRNA synthetase